MSNFEPNAKLLLRSSEQHIESEDIEALKNIRAKALQQPLKRRLPSFLAPAAGMVTASLLAFVIISGPLPIIKDDSLSTADTSELYEDLGFYYWLASENIGIDG